jgi:hypothetical protein
MRAVAIRVRSGDRSGNCSAGTARDRPPLPRGRGLSITQIAQRIGRSPATVKADFYDPTGEKAKAVKTRYQSVCRGCGAPPSRATHPGNPVWVVAVVV